MLLAMLASLAAAHQPAAATQPVCQNARPQVAGSIYTPNGARAQRLDTLPPADLVLTVLRTENGCSRPVIVRYGIGQRPARGR